MSEYGEVVEAVVCKDKDKPEGYGYSSKFDMSGAFKLTFEPTQVALSQRSAGSSGKDCSLSATP